MAVMCIDIDGVNCPYCNHWITELDTISSQSDVVCPFCLQTVIVAKSIEYQAFKSDEQFIFGKNLKKLRSTMNMKQKEFAELLGIPQPSISAYENGRNQPTLDVLITIALRCNISIDWLCGLRPEQSLPNSQSFADLDMKKPSY